MIKTFIINFNLLAWPRAMAEWLADSDGVEVVIVDNCSNYPPLLEWYRQCPFTVYHMPRNLSCRVVWTSGLVEREVGNGHYAVTDPDLSFEMVPGDFLGKLVDAFERHPEVTKAGLSIEYRDLPAANPAAAAAADWEAKMWTRPLEPGVLQAPVDTTFAIYHSQRRWRPQDFLKAVRLERPYTLRHLPWYLTPGNIPDEYLHYQKTANRDASWQGLLSGLAPDKPTSGGGEAGV